MAHPLEGCYLSAELPDEPVMAIAHFRDDVGPVPQNPAVLFTITIDKTQLSPSGRLIRLESGTSEVHGWFRRDQIHVEEVLGKAVNENGSWKAVAIKEAA